MFEIEDFSLTLCVAQHYDMHDREQETTKFLREVVSKFGERELSLEELDFEVEAPRVLQGSVNPIVPMETDMVHRPLSIPSLTSHSLTHSLISSRSVLHPTFVLSGQSKPREGAAGISIHRRRTLPL